jgi:hypothetical protein
MPDRSTRIAMVRGLPLPLRRAALRAAFARCGSDERPLLALEIADLAAASGEPADATPIARAWAELPADDRQALTRRLGTGLLGVVGVLRESDDPASRAAAARIVADLVAEGPQNDRDEADLDDALALAASDFPEHRVAEVLTALLVRAHDAGPRVREFLERASDPTHMALRSAARSGPAGLLRARAVSWLDSPALGPVSRDMLERAADPALTAAAFEQHHLLRARQRDTMAAKIERSERLLASGPASMLSVRARVGRLAWAGVVRLRAEARLDLLHQTISDPDARVRLAAARDLSRQPPTPAGDEALTDFAFDPHPAVAAAAASALVDATASGRRRALAPALDRLRRSPHDMVRALAEQARRGRSPGGADWPAAAGARARRSVRDRAGDLESIETGLAAGVSDHVVAALDLAQRRGLVDQFRARIETVATGPDERAAAKAALVLGELNDAGSARTIEALLSHPSGRVRASAVEAMTRRRPADTRFNAWTSDEVPRVRANALRHTIRRGGLPARHAQTVLSEMLADVRAGHRLSALWVAQRVRDVSLAQRVGDLARLDPEPAVRERAQRCSIVLAGAMRQAWSTRLVTPSRGEVAA